MIFWWPVSGIGPVIFCIHLCYFIRCLYLSIEICKQLLDPISCDAPVLIKEDRCKIIFLLIYFTPIDNIKFFDLDYIIHSNKITQTCHPVNGGDMYSPDSILILDIFAGWDRYGSGIIMSFNYVSNITSWKSVRGTTMCLYVSHTYY